MKKALALTFFSLLAALCLLAAGRGWADQAAGDAVRGGRIYDNWVLTLGAAQPPGDQPLWRNQDTNRRNGAVTWLCTECHGWDYKGVQGMYGLSTGHYTGFPSLQGMVGAPQQEVMAWLDGTRNPEHNFLQYMGHMAVQDLAAFLRTQQADVNLIIDPRTGLSLGDADSGQVLYEETCAGCHGGRGDRILLGDELSYYLADSTIADPWQAVHKICFGAPVSRGMPATEELGWSLSRVADVLAYAQTLRRANPSLTAFGTVNDPVQVERQGQIEPLIWGAFLIFFVVIAGVTTDFYRQRSAAKPARARK